jgi:hypothetical protein
MKTKETKPGFLGDSIATGFVKEFRTFGVGVAVGLAPFFGDVPIPGFRPLIKIFPSDVKVFLLTVAPFLLGWVAATVKFYFHKKTTQAVRKRLFGISSAVVVAAVLVLVYLHNFYLIEVDAPDGPRLVIVGSERLPCICPSSVSDPDCIKILRFNPVPCWRDHDIKVARTSFELDYLLLNVGFGVIVGVLRLDRPRSGPAKRQAAGRGRAPKGIAKKIPAEAPPIGPEPPTPRPQAAQEPEPG